MYFCYLKWDHINSIVFACDLIDSVYYQVSEEDVSQFDSKFTKQTPIDSPCDSTLSDSYNKIFEVCDNVLGDIYFLIYF